MMDQIHLTVAVVVEREHRFLMVREIRNGLELYNQPAGHVEPGETPIQAAIRETLEETTWHVVPAAIISFTTFRAPANGITYYRLAFAADADRPDPLRVIDQDIEEAVWLTYEEILQKRQQLRSPMVLEAIEDYRRGIFYSLDLLKTHR